MSGYLYELATENDQQQIGFVDDLFKLVCIAMIIGGFVFMAAAMIGVSL